MAKLKKVFETKIKASSITETMVATTIIIVVFVIVTFSLHTVLRNRIEKDTSLIEFKLNQLIYQHKFEKLKIPTNLIKGDWEVQIFNEQEYAIDWVVFEAVLKGTKKKVVKKIIANEN